MGAFIEGIQAEFEELVNEVVAITDVDLVINDPQQPDVRIIRTQETNLGDLCADAYRFISGADVAIVNGRRHSQRDSRRGHHLWTDHRRASFRQ